MNHLAQLVLVLCVCLLSARLYFYLLRPEKEPDAEPPPEEETPAQRYIREMRHG